MRKKGFTLIELLAVIVILAAIALIVTPIIISIITDSKKGSFETSANQLLDAADVAYNTTQLTNNPEETKYTYANGVQTKETGNIVLNYQGDKPKTGVLLISANGNISMALYNGTYCATKPYDSKKITIEEKALVDCEIDLVEPLTPTLVEGLIPVYYDNNSMVWKKADESNINNKWYQYSAFKWANAVTVTEATRSSYMNAAVGTPISMADINTMFVWIPRYKYRIPTGTGPREILVKFELSDAPNSTGDAIDTYYTHPAFTFGGKTVNGVWVGKFEVTGSIADITIKPDLQSLRSQGNKAFFEGIKTMEGNIKYGFGTDSDIHMIKNMEWGAIAYLSHSKYGKYGNPDYSGANKELYINNSNSYYTGRSRGEPPISISTTGGGRYTYDGKCASISATILYCTTGTSGVTLIPDKTLSYGASTSGTIYGIYDMSGGAFESVMGMYYPTPIPATGIRDCSGYSTNYPPDSCPTTSPYDSQYDLFNITNTDYYDRYLSTTIATGYIKGDATYETSGWYSDFTTNIALITPWYARGSSQMWGTQTGIFSFTNSNGNLNSLVTTRVVLLEK